MVSSLIIAIIVIVVLLAILLSYIYFRPIEKNETISGKLIKKAKFVAKSHKVKGEAQIIKKGDDLYLFLKDFYTVRGPDVLLVLSADLKAKEQVSLGYLKATKGNFYVKLPKDIDLKRYNKVLIWCRAFRVLFSYAEFTE